MNILQALRNTSLKMKEYVDKKHTWESLPDKPFGDISSSVVLVDGLPLNWENDDGVYNTRLSGLYGVGTIYPEIGKTYRITLDNDVFDIICEDDYAICYNDENINFSIELKDIYFYSEASYSTIKIEELSEDVKQLDEKFIPDTIARTNHTHEELSEAIENITTGDIVVKESEHSSTAEHSVSADTATEATHAASSDHATSAENAEHATTADEATKAIQDGNGNVITDTYETKEDAQAKLEEAKLYTDTEISEIYVPFEKASSVGTVSGPLLTVDLQQFVDAGVSKAYNFANDTNTGVIKFVFGDLYTTSTKSTTFSIQVRISGDDVRINVYLSDGEIVFQKQDGVYTIESYLFVDGSKVLRKNNTTEYTPTSDYNPATKKYVDDTVANIDLTSYETIENSNNKLEEAKAYADQVKSDILGGAPKETLDTIVELATAFEENAEVVGALDAAITNKADKNHYHSWNELSDRPFYEEIDSYLSYLSETSFSYMYDHSVSSNQFTFEHKDSLYNWENPNETGWVILDDEIYKGTFVDMMDNYETILINYNGYEFGFVPLDDDVTRIRIIIPNDYNKELFIGDHKIKIIGGEYLFKQIPEKFIPDTIAHVEYVDDCISILNSNKSDIGHTHSWNDLEDKPFGEEVDVIYEESNLNWRSGDLDNYYISLQDDFNLVSGEEYIITLTDGNNEMVYNSVCREYGEYGYLCFYLDDEYLFEIVYNKYLEKYMLWSYYQFDSVKIEKQAIIEINEQYIPNTIARVKDVPEHTWKSLPDKPFGEKIDIICSGTDLIWNSGDLNDYYVSLHGNFDLVQGEEYIITVVDGDVEKVYTYVSDEYGLRLDDGYDSRITYSSYSKTYTFWSYHCYSSMRIEKIIESKQLDEKFIPDTIARVSDLPEGFSGSWNDLTDKPFGSYYEQDLIAYLNSEIYQYGSHLQIPDESHEAVNRVPSSIRMEVIDGGLDAPTIFDQVLQRQGKIEHIGNDFWHSFWWYGNLNLITSELDREAKYAINDLNLTETKYSDVPFVYYGYVYEVYGEPVNYAANDFKIIFSDDLTPSNDMIGYRINIYDASTEGTLVYTQLDEQYIPESIARVSDLEELKPLIVTFSGAGIDDFPYSCDVDFATIREAIHNGKVVEFYTNVLHFGDGSKMVDSCKLHLYEGGMNFEDYITLRGAWGKDYFEISYISDNSIYVREYKDSVSWDDLEGKPFYEYYTIEHLTSVTFDEDGQELISVDGLELKENAIYRIIVETSASTDEYEYKCIYGSNPTLGFYGNILVEKDVNYQGTPDYTSSGTMIYSEKINRSVLTVDIDSSKISIPCTVSISEYVPAIQTLDEKYIPETIARISDIPDIPEVAEHTWANLPDKPFGEEVNEYILLDADHDFTNGNIKLTGRLADVGEGNQVIIEIDDDVYTATVHYEGNPVYDYYLDNYSEGCPIECAFRDVRDNSGSLGNVHIKIYKADIILKTIDEKFLPEHNEVKYIEQTLAEAQQMQARKNLGLYCSNNELVMHQVIDMDNNCKIVERILWDDFSEDTEYVAVLAGYSFKSVSYNCDQIGYNDYYVAIEFTSSDNKLPSATRLYYENGKWTFADNGYTFAWATGLQEIKVYKKSINVVPEEYIPDTIARISDVLKQSDILTSANKNSEDTSYSPTLESDVATKAYVDSIVPTADDALALVAEIGFVNPSSNDGYVFTDENGAIYTL